MNWKEFLKPTKGKIILFIILIAVGAFLGLIIAALNTRLASAEAFGQDIPSMGDIFVFLLGIFVSIIISPFLLIEIILFPEISVFAWGMLFFVVDLIFWYLISCVLIFAFGKFKDKKKSILVLAIILVVALIILLVSVLLNAHKPSEPLYSYPDIAAENLIRKIDTTSYVEVISGKVTFKTGTSLTAAGLADVTGGLTEEHICLSIGVFRGKEGWKKSTEKIISYNGSTEQRARLAGICVPKDKTEKISEYAPLLSDAWPNPSCGTCKELEKCCFIAVISQFPPTD